MNPVGIYGAENAIRAMVAAEKTEAQFDSAFDAAIAAGGTK